MWAHSTRWHATSYMAMEGLHLWVESYSSSGALAETQTPARRGWIFGSSQRSALVQTELRGRYTPIAWWPHWSPRSPGKMPLSPGRGPASLAARGPGSPCLDNGGSRCPGSRSDSPGRTVLLMLTWCLLNSSTRRVFWPQQLKLCWRRKAWLSRQAELPVSTSGNPSWPPQAARAERLYTGWVWRADQGEGTQQNNEIGEQVLPAASPTLEQTQTSTSSAAAVAAWCM